MRSGHLPDLPGICKKNRADIFTFFQLPQNPAAWRFAGRLQGLQSRCGNGAGGGGRERSGGRRDKPSRTGFRARWFRKPDRGAGGHWTITVTACSLTPLLP